LDDQTWEIAELRGNMQQLDKLATLANRQTTIQIAAIVITLCLTIAGAFIFKQILLTNENESGAAKSR
jgi:hypothetical protein